MFVIEDGTGESYKARVTSNNELSVAATNVTAGLSASVKGNGYVFTTQPISLTTTGSYNGILHIKNDSSHNMHLGVMGFTSTVASNLWQAVKNATTGTLISGASAANINNANFGKVSTFDGLCYKGADGTTVTNGDIYGAFIAQASHTGGVAEFLTLAPGSSISFLCKPASSCSVCITGMIYLEDQEA